jgi:replication-associated recombination protein RarA
MISYKCVQCGSPIWSVSALPSSEVIKVCLDCLYIMRKSGKRSLKLLNIFKKKGIFDGISGNENIKWAFEQALRAPEPVHILLVGPPGIGKTRFLKAIENRFRDQSYFALSSGATGAGMLNQLFETQPKYLLVDEIEDMKKSDEACLLSLMQDGELVETKIKGTRRINLRCNVFATSNDTKKLREPLLTRFTVFHMDEYTKEEFVQVAIDQLDCDADFAAYIAENVWTHMKKPNLRDCERLCNLCDTEADVLRMLEMVS